MDEGVSEGKLTGASVSGPHALWRTRIVEDRAGIDALLPGVRRIAVLGIKPEIAGGPAYTVPAYLASHGFDVVPVPVYFPEVTEILGRPVVRQLRTVDPPAEVIQIFRRPPDIPQHVDDIIAAAPRVVWMQLGIRNDAVSERLARAGILVVQDRCLQVEHARWAMGR
jgi:hypothetical protein